MHPLSYLFLKKTKREHRIHSVRNAFFFGGIQWSEAERLRGGETPSWAFFPIGVYVPYHHFIFLSFTL
jgi:hypothetical protein